MNESNLTGNPDHIAVLNKSIELKDPSIWNQWKVGSDRPNLNGINLSNEVLNGYNLEFTDLNLAILKNVTFLRCAFNETHLTNTTIESCSFRHTFIEYSDFFESDIQKSEFIFCNLEDSQFRYCKLIDVNFRNSYLFQTFFTHSCLNIIYFWNSNLKSSSFTCAEIFYSDFSNAILNGIDFSYALIINCRVYGTAAWDLQLNNSTQKRTYSYKGRRC